MTATIHLNPFIIDFLYDGLPYRGLVTPKEKTETDSLSYTVKVESENQELFLDIIANPCGTDKMDWCFQDADKAPGDARFDKDFLQEIGEAIEKHESGN
jgi:hypothetical protein